MTNEIRDGWRHYDVHGLLGIRVKDSTPSTRALAEFLGGFATRESVPRDVTVLGHLEPLHEATLLDAGIRCTADTVEFSEAAVQIRRTPSGFTVQGPGDLVDPVLAVVDLLAVRQGAAMTTAVSLAYRGSGIALYSTSGGWQNPVIARLVRQPGFSFMGHSLAFVTKESQQLGFVTPMTISSEHRSIYPHLFERDRGRPLGKYFSAPLAEMANVIRPHMNRAPRIAAATRRLTRRGRTISATHVLSGVAITRQAASSLNVFIETYEGAVTTVSEVPPDQIVPRLMGILGLHPPVPASIAHGLDASFVSSLFGAAARKSDLLQQALGTTPNLLLRIPSVLDAEQRCDDIIYHVDKAIGRHGVGADSKTIDLREFRVTVD